MARESLIFICASLILTQFVVVNADKDVSTNISLSLSDLYDRRYNNFIGHRLDYYSRRVKKIGWKFTEKVYERNWRVKRYVFQNVIKLMTKGLV